MRQMRMTTSHNPLNPPSSARIPAASRGATAPALPPPRQIWRQTRRRLNLAVEDLRRAVIERCEHHPDRTRVVVALDEAIVDLEQLIDAFDGPLFELLDAADAASDRDVREEVLQRLGQYVAEGRHDFARDELVELMDDNGFVELDLRSGLDGALADLARRMGVPAASDTPSERR